LRRLVLAPSGSGPAAGRRCVGRLQWYRQRSVAGLGGMPRARWQRWIGAWKTSSALRAAF